MNQHPSGPNAPTTLRHDYGVSAGELIRFELHARGLTQADLAARAGVSAKHLNQVIQGVVPLSADTALRLERTLGTPAAILSQADAISQSHKHRAKSHVSMAEHRAWYEKFPQPALRRLGQYEPSAPIESQIEALLEYLGVADPNAFDAVYGEALISFRRAQRWIVDPYATALWLRSAELRASEIEGAVYDKTRFRDLLRDLPELTTLEMADAFPRLQDLCADAGVAVVYNPGIDGTRVSAAVRWLGPERPVIALSERGKFEDSLWFSFFHEAAHVVLHPRRKSVVELSDPDDGDGAESEANEFAKATILCGYLDDLMGTETREQIVELAGRAGIDPGLAAAIRAYEGDADGWRIASKLRRKLDVRDLT